MLSRVVRQILQATVYDVAIETPLEAEVELLKETGRLLFLRGVVTQNEGRIAAFSGTIRKPTKR